MVGQKYFKGGGGKRAFGRGKTILNIIKQTIRKLQGVKIAARGRASPLLALLVSGLLKQV